jgi:hypothetical protein
MSSRTNTDAIRAIDALGGPKEVARLMDVKPNAVANWYKRGLPRHAHDALGPMLEQAGFKFSPKLFKQHVIKRGKA